MNPGYFVSIFMTVFVTVCGYLDHQHVLINNILITIEQIQTSVIILFAFDKVRTRCSHKKILNRIQKNFSKITIIVFTKRVKQTT